MNAIDANDLKTYGVSIIETALAKTSEIAISISGKQCFVVMDIEKYQDLQELELEIALTQAKADITAGHYTTESVDAHLQRLFENNRMKDEYDFSNAEQGKFYVPIDEIEIEKKPNTCSSWRKKMTIQPILQVPPDQLIQPLDDVWENYV